MNVERAKEEYIDELELVKDRATSTIKVRRRGVERFEAYLADKGVDDIENVTRRHIAGFVDHIVDQGYSKNSVMKTHYDSVSAFMSFHEREGNLADNPLARIERSAMRSKAEESMSDDEKKNKGPKDYLTKRQVYELADNAPEPSVRNELLIKMLFWTGMRVSEIVTVNIGQDGTLDGPGSDIDPDQPRIDYYSSKTDEPHVASYPRPELNPLLRDYVQNGRLRYKCASETDQLFLAQKGPITTSGVRDMFRQATKQVDLDGVNLNEVERVGPDGRKHHKWTPHSLRHSFAMHHHNERGVSLDDIKTALNHSSISITEDFYAEGTEDRIIDVFGDSR